MHQQMLRPCFDARMHRSKCPYRAGRPTAPYNAPFTLFTLSKPSGLIWAREFATKRRHFPTGALPPDDADADVDLSPIDLMRQLAAEHGVRVASSSSSLGGTQWSSSSGGGKRFREADMDAEEAEEEAEEEESWEDAVADLGNPWDMRPAKVDLMDEDDRGLPGPTVASPGPASAAAPSPEPRSSTVLSPYSDPSAFPRIGWRELLDLAGFGSDTDPGGDPVAGGSSCESEVVTGSSGPIDSGSSWGGGYGAVSLARAVAGAKAEAGGRARVVVLDVQEEHLESEGSEEDEEAAASRLSPAVAASASLSLPAEVAAVVPYVHVPLSSLRRPEAEALAKTWDYVVVAATGGDHRAQQAVVRLTRVYGLRRVLLYDHNAE